MKLTNIFANILFLCCFSIVACSALTPAALTPEQQEQLNWQLIKAAEDGDLPAAEQALENGADIDADDNQALYVAVNNNNVNMVIFLVKHGADIHAENDLAVRWAAAQGNLPMVQFLMEHGADIHAENDEALFAAVELDYIEFLEFLIEHGANIHANNDEALQWAAQNNSWTAVACLLHHGADRTKLTAEQQERLHHSARAHRYILTELQKAVKTHVWHKIDAVLSIIPHSALPENVQANISTLIAPAMAS